MLIVGVDPGSSGGAAVLSIDDKTGRPRMEPTLLKFADLTDKQLSDLFWKIAFDANEANEPVLTFLEKIHARPAVNRIRSPDGEITRQEVFASVSSLGKFMENYGILQGILITIGLMPEYVRPQDWQAALGCLTRGNKNISKAKALDLYPGVKVTHATADALLIAEFGRRARSNFIPANGGFTKVSEITDRSQLQLAVTGSSQPVSGDGDVPF